VLTRGLGGYQKHEQTLVGYQGSSQSSLQNILRLTVFFWSRNNLSKWEPAVLLFWKQLTNQNRWFFGSQLIRTPHSLLAGIIYKNWNWWLWTKSNTRPNTCVDAMLQKEGDPKALARRDSFKRTSRPGFDTKLRFKFRIGSSGVGLSLLLPIFKSCGSGFGTFFIFNHCFTTVWKLGLVTWTYYTFLNKTGDYQKSL